MTWWFTTVTPDDGGPDEYKALSPLGTAPVMTWGLALCESSASWNLFSTGHQNRT
ncbi:MAG: hypothetical protein CM15mP84_09600 [Cellvibrionales bacterium]|nr:MAG: hypothetical protein CM15mP84_09600 [Cellvibrionales bacterium]